MQCLVQKSNIFQHVELFKPNRGVKSLVLCAIHFPFVCDLICSLIDYSSLFLTISY